MVREGAAPSVDPAARRARVGALLVLAATLGFAFKGIFARLAYEAGLASEDVLMLRLLLAAPLYALALAWKLRSPSLRALPRADWIRAAAVGVLFISSGAADFFAIERIGAGPSRVILFTHPAMILAWQALRQHRPPTRSQTLAFAGAWIGLWFAAGMGPGTEELQLDPVGIALSIFSALGYAGYLIASQGLMKRMGSAPFICIANISGLAYVFLIEWGLGVLPSPGSVPVSAWGPIVALVLVSTVVPALAFTEGLHRLGPARTSLLSLIGPPTTIAAAALVLGESMTAWQLLGCGLVLASISRLKSPSPRPARPALRTAPPRPSPRSRRPLTTRPASASTKSARL